MTVRVTMVDYGMGNLYSVTRALEHCGAEVELTASPKAVMTAERLVLPGVGAFADGMVGLKDRGLIESIAGYGRSGRPLLGICLGMQMLLSESEEFGEHAGLGLIPGKVVAVPATTSEGAPHKIPHIGWNRLLLPNSLPNWSGTIFSGVVPGESAYFVHSYTAIPDDPLHRLSDSYYGGQLISAAIRSGSIYGCQFHPEKSGEVGLRILREFINLRAAS